MIDGAEITYTIAHLENDVERGRELIQEYSELLGRGAEALAVATIETRLRFRSSASFRAALEREIARAERTQEEVGIIELSIDRELTELEHARVAEQLRTVANRTGDEIGRTERGGYAAFFPWTTPEEISSLSRTLAKAASQIAADADISIGSILTCDATNSPEMAPVMRGSGPTLSRGRG